MRFIEIDGKTYDVACCNECPCFNETGGDSWEHDECKHPQNVHCMIREPGEYGPDCPLRDKDEKELIVPMEKMKESVKDWEDIVDKDKDPILAILGGRLLNITDEQWEEYQKAVEDLKEKIREYQRLRSSPEGLVQYIPTDDDLRRIAEDLQQSPRCRCDQGERE